MNIYPLTTILILLFVFISCDGNKKKERLDTDTSPTTNIIADDLEIKEAVTVEKRKRSSLSLYLENQGLVNIQTLDSTILVDLKYATTDNFTKVILYDTLFEAYLHPMAAEKLIKAQQRLKEYDSELTLLVYDGARPMSVQKRMYKVVQNTPYKAYVADPSKTGLHNYGMAVDLTIARADETTLDMGTSFDFFGKAAGINQEEQLLREGLLTREQIDNRKLLRKVMTEAGFIPIRGEWWHFNAVSREVARKNYKLID